jgi:tetraprenyl-beta-curcumene synthase
LPAVSREVRHWRRRARAITDAPLRADALDSLERKRASTDGAALFWTLPHARDPNLLRLLVAFETLADYLDSASERGVYAGVAGGLQLHRALSDALDPGAPLSSYYRYHPWRRDGGYLRALLAACRYHCALLPHYERVRAPAIRAATLARVLALNHLPDPHLRDAALREWAHREIDCPPRSPTVREVAVEWETGSWGKLAWFESTAAASGWLTVLALLALAAAGEEPEAGRVRDTCTAYFPWISLAGTMLDSYCDQAEDTAADEHSYIAHYPCPAQGVERVSELVWEAAQRAAALPDGSRHTVIVGCMVAMYLSRDSARTPTMRASTHRLAHAGGPLARLLLPVLRLWRVAYSQRAT